MALGLLGSVAGLGQMLLGQAGISALGNLSTYMMLSPFVDQSSQDMMIADATAGVGQAYLNGAATLHHAIYQMNAKIGEVFSKAGGH